MNDALGIAPEAKGRLVWGHCWDLNPLPLLKVSKVSAVSSLILIHSSPKEHITGGLLLAQTGEQSEGDSV